MIKEREVQADMNKRITDVDIATLANVINFFVNDGENIAQLDKQELFDEVKPDLSEYAKSADVNKEIDKLKSTDKTYLTRLEYIQGKSIPLLDENIARDEKRVSTLESSLKTLNGSLDSVKTALTVFDYEDIVAGGKFYIKKAGLYIFAGADYCLNLYNSSDGNSFSLVGNKNNLIMGIIATQNKNYKGLLRTFYGKTYQNTLKIASAESNVIDLFNDTEKSKHAYVQNAHSSNNSIVFYVRPQGE